MRPHLIVAAVLVLSGSMATAETSPRASLRYALRHMAGPGDVIYQAGMDGFDYRFHLRRAMAMDRQALAALFDYTDRGHLMGVGAEEHSGILRDLLRVWGDDSFARVLRSRDPAVRRRVVGWMFPYSGQRSREFPKTYRVTPRDDEKA